MQSNLGIKYENEEVDVSLLKQLPKNPRTMDLFTEGKLQKSLDDYGLVIPLLVDKDYVVLGGNQRMKKLKGKVWVKKISDGYENITDDDIKNIVLMSNQEVGKWDFLKLDSFEFSNDEYADLGFSDEEISDMKFSLTDFDFGEFDDAKVIKKLIINFSGYENVRELIASAKEKYGHSDFESVLLDICKDYEKDHS